MNETHATKYLLGLPHAQPNGTAERERRLLEALGNPQKNIFVIKILGEAGKSSASFLLASLLAHGGVSAGQVTLTPQGEPRLALLCDGKSPTHATFAAAVTMTWNAARASAIDDPSYEEILLAAALVFFAENGCRTAIVELSASGRSSAASALLSPPLCLMTSTGEAAAERLVPLIDTAGELISAPQAPAVYRRLTERAATTHCRLTVPIKNDIGEATVHGGVLRFVYRGTQHSLATAAHYQKNNALVVIEAYHALLRRGFRLTEKHLADAFAQATSPLCFRFFSLSPVWLIDTADSPLRLAALADSVEKLPSLFGDTVAIWSEPSLEDACRDAFGNRLSLIECFDTKALRRTLKTKRPPAATPLLIVGSKEFATEALRSLQSWFL